MATITETAPTAIQAVLNFYGPPPDGSQPYNIVYDVPEGTPTRNYQDNKVSVSVVDARGREQEFSLDTNGFAFNNRDHGFSNWTDGDAIKAEYYPDVIDAVKSATGAAEVIIFDHTIRTKDGYRNPVQFVHVDQTPWSASERVRLHAPHRLEGILNGKRFQIINYWKPLSGPVEEFPLALGDAKNMGPDDVVHVQHRYRDRNGETGSVKYNPGQEFYYLKGMNSDEEIFIKCYDSKQDVAIRTPHTAFVDPESPANARPRESIEVRTLVFYD
ncbi:uncharacterized protein V1516DRAFT_684639 [Lipomyces oligophaga]|uniref:uncharacterized protein n=1 Tax=Lipomyces oligophaga TaxID=45792 RepID=UPI0034CDA99F